MARFAGGPWDGLTLSVEKGRNEWLVHWVPTNGLRDGITEIHRYVRTGERQQVWALVGWRGLVEPG